MRSMLMQCLCLVVILGCAYSMPIEFDYDCTGLPEGFLYWWACGSYGICRGGEYAQIDCLNGTSYDRRTGGCVPSNQQASFPCNAAPRDCEAYNGPGHRYPDQNQDPIENLPACTFYFTCSYGRYLGHQRCSDGTVYAEGEQRCLPQSQVPPPCGFLTEPNTFGFQGSFVDGRQVVQPQTDNFGNPDFNTWPFGGGNPPNNRQQQQPPPPQRQGQGQGGPGPVQGPPSHGQGPRQFYRSVDDQEQQQFNPSVFTEFSDPVESHND